MRPRKSHEVASALCKKGFRKRKAHHIFFELYVSGKREDIRTKISHSHKEVAVSLQRQMARQILLCPPEFDQLIDCPMSGEQYLKLLYSRRKGANGHRDG